MYKSLRPLIYQLTPEQAHHLTITLLRIAGSLPPAAALLKTMFRANKTGPKVNAFGLEFTNPIGMAAGYDKDALAILGLACLGFSHIEVGTVTLKGQPGNPQPRLFRLVEDQAVINRMGFNNHGAEFMANRLHKPRPKGCLIGVNIGKNKSTPLDEAHLDYLNLMRIFAPLADYLAINISSPNTPGLRSLQNRVTLENLLRPLSQEKKQLEASLKHRVPVLIKLAPDLSDIELDEAISAILDYSMDGIIISNTTITRPPLKSQHSGEVGGLSGAPLTLLSNKILEKTVQRLHGQIPVIASGGVMSPEDAKIKMDLGATLVQVYTGLIYSGPGLVREIINAL